MHGPIFPGVTANATQQKNSSTDKKKTGIKLGSEFCCLGAKLT